MSAPLRDARHARAGAGPGVTARPLGDAVEAVGDRWTLLVVGALLGEPQRFADLLAAVPGISTNVLTDRLRRLERDGLVVARPYRDRPRRFLYELTEPGVQLGEALRALSRWGARRLGADDAGAAEAAALRHRTCGGPVELQLHCPHCDRLVDDADVDDLRWI